MPIELTWLLPDTILLSRWSGEITEQNMRVLVEELGIILDAAPRLIHTLIDLSETRHIQNEAAYYYFRSRIPSHPRRGRIALVRAPFQGAALADVFNRVSAREMFRTFNTRDEACNFLLHHDTPPPATTPPDRSLNDTDSPVSNPSHPELPGA
jgi:hypothetical protein